MAKIRKFQSDLWVEGRRNFYESGNFLIFEKNFKFESIEYLQFSDWTYRSRYRADPMNYLKTADFK